MLLVISATIPALIVILISGIERERLELRALQDNAEGAVAQIANTYLITVAETRRTLAVLSSLSEVRSPDPRPCSELFARLLRENPQFLTLQVSRDGWVFAAGSPLGDPVYVGDRKYYKDAFNERRFAVGEYIIGRTVHEPQLNFAYPILDTNSAVAGVVQAGYTLAYFGDLLKRCKVPWPGAIAVVMDCAGTNLNLFPAQPERVGQPENPALFRQMTNLTGTFHYDSGAGSQFVAYRQLRLDHPGAESPYLIVRLAIPEQPMLAKVHAVLLRNLLPLGMAATLAVLAAWHFGNLTMIKPVRALVKSMQRLGAGDLTPRVSPIRGGRELEQLAQGFDNMAEMVLSREREREKDKLALMRGEQRFRLLFNSTADSLFVYELSPDFKPGNFVEVNDAACARLGYSREEFARMTPADINDGSGALNADELEHFTSSGQAAWEGVHVAKDGRRIPCEITSRLFEMDGRRMALSTAREISDRKAAEEEKLRLEDQLRQAQKMEAVGRLAGGVAHDFNNLLTAILGNAELLLEDQIQEPFRSGVEEIQRVSLRAASLTRQLLTFSRKQVVSPTVVNLNDRAAESREMIHRLIGEQIELVFHADPELWPIHADPSQIDQVLMNLAVNSRDAMPKGGRLVVETANLTLGPDDPPPFPGCAPGQWVSLAISDNGYGMSRETQQHIFEPFFTTKEKGKGTGLGLATVYGIVKQCGGGISVASELDVGAKFTLFFPRTRENGASDLVSSANFPAMGGTESILLAEDESAVRELVRRTLQNHGYRVIPVPDGFAALTVFDPENTDVLVTDVIMPGMNGYELHRALCTLKPQLKVLYMSGHIDDALIQSEISSGNVHFIHKPFKTTALLKKLRQVLNGEEP